MAVIRSSLVLMAGIKRATARSLNYKNKQGIELHCFGEARSSVLEHALVRVFNLDFVHHMW